MQAKVRTRSASVLPDALEKIHTRFKLISNRLHSKVTEHTPAPGTRAVQAHLSIKADNVHFTFACSLSHSAAKHAKDTKPPEVL